MGNTRDTGHLRDIVTYDGSDNVTFPANVSLVAPAGSDNSTKVPSTAWVRTYVSGVASLSTSGTSGANGSSGSSGQTGASGSSGSSGSSGQTGVSGSSGSSGSTGTSGSSGSSGQTGASGSSGSSGSSGQTGAAGSSGSSGQTGAAGSSGSSGSSGQTGAAGSSGSSGQSGAAGSSGSSGSSGQSGAAGSSGSSGQSGAAGSSGSSGSSGQNGASGSSGSSGQSGAAGSSGSSGSSGTSPSTANYVYFNGTSTRFAGDLNTLGLSATTGVYNIGAGYTNGPGSTTLYGTMYAVWNSDISTQFWVSYNGSVYWRQSVGTTYTGSTWKTIWDSANLTNLNQLTNGPGYITSYTETSTLANVMTRGNSTGTQFISTSSTPFSFQYNSNTGTYNQTTIYANQNNTSANTANGIFIERGRLTDSASAEIRYFVIGARGGSIQWQVDGSGNTYQTGTISASNFSGTSSGTNTGDQTNISGNAATVTHNASRTDSTSYNVGWFSGSNSPAYSCNAVQIQSSTGTLTATNLTGTLKQRYSSTGTRMWNPPGGIITTSPSTQTGALTITMPKMTDVMISFWIDVYDYGTNTTFSVFVSGYPYSSAGVWSYTSAMILGAVSRQFTVRFGGSNDNTKSIVYIGETSTVWSYPQVQVRDVLIGYNALTGNVDGLDWAISWSTTLLNVGVTRTDVLPYASNANTLGGNSLNQTGGANTVVQRDANGYIQNTYFYASGGGSERNASGMGYFVGHNSSDYYYRSYTAGAAATLLGLGSMAYASTGSYLALSGGTVTGDTTFGSNSTTDQGIRINYGNYVSGYGRIRFLQDGSNHQTIHSFSASWQSGTLSASSTGAININGQNGVTFGPWNVPDAYITTNGSAWFRYDVTAYSDSRVKENVLVIDNAIQRIKSIRGVTFTRNDRENKDQRHAGVIAQEVLEVFPEVVTQDAEGMYSVSYGNMAGLFIEAIKEQQTQIEDQALEIRNLKALVGSLLGKNLK